MSDETKTPWTVRNCGNEAHGPTWECHRVEDASGIVLLRNVTRDVAEQYASLPLLEQQLASERAAREKAEADLEEEVATWQNASGLERGGDPGGVRPADLERHLAQLLARAEQAKQERDTFCLAASTAQDATRDWRARAERAEADNAALLSVLRRFREPKPAEAHPDSAQAFMRWHMANERAADEALAADHPGAALLEELGRLRERWQYVAGLLGVADGGQYRADWDAPVMRLLERLRALEEVRVALTPFWVMAETLVEMRAEAPPETAVRRTPMGADLSHVLTMEHCRALAAAIAKADALRGKA